MLFTTTKIILAKLLYTYIYIFFEEIFFQLMKLMEQYTILKYLILELRIDISSFYVAIGICSRDNLECNFTPIHKGNFYFLRLSTLTARGMKYSLEGIMSCQANLTPKRNSCRIRRFNIFSLLYKIV